MSRASEIFQAIEDYLREMDWNYDVHEEQSIISTRFFINGKMKSVEVFFNVKESLFVIYTVLPLVADNDDTKIAVAEFLTRANYGLILGNFEMDYHDGEVRYKTSHFCGDAELSQEQIKYEFVTNIQTVQRYGEAFIKVLFGILDPEETVAEAEK